MTASRIAFAGTALILIVGLYGIFKSPKNTGALHADDRYVSSRFRWLDIVGGRGNYSTTVWCDTKTKKEIYQGYHGQITLTSEPCK